MSFETRYNKWQSSVFDQVQADHPEINLHSIEICETGEVFIHDGGAYPIILKGYKKWEE